MEPPFLKRTPVVHSRILPHYPFYAARSAVLMPFDGRLARRGKFFVPTVFHNLWEAWVGFVVRMGKVGWPDKQSPSFVANCPYFGVKGHGWDPCTQARICPFCWGRERVIRPYSEIEKRIPKSRKYRNGHGLIEFTFKHTYPYISMGTYGTPTEQYFLDQIFPDIRRRIARDMRREIDCVDYEGAFVSHSIDLKPGKAGVFTIEFRRSGLMLVRDDRDPTRLPDTKYKPDAPVTNQALMESFSRTARYPVGWLKYGRPEQVKVYLDSLARAKLTQRYGDWYG